MVKSHADARLLLSPGLKDAPVLDRMCSQFVLTLTMHAAGRFNLRRDWNSLLSLTGRHLVWPVSVLVRSRIWWLLTANAGALIRQWYVPAGRLMSPAPLVEPRLWVSASSTLNSRQLFVPALAVPADALVKTSAYFK